MRAGQPSPQYTSNAEAAGRRQVEVTFKYLQYLNIKHGKRYCGEGQGSLFTVSDLLWVGGAPGCSLRPSLRRDLRASDSPPM
jgi:hypothetical protein